MRARVLVPAMLLVVFAEALSFAQSPMINYQGKVTDSGGGLLNGTYSMQFKIYSQQTAGTALWTETQVSVSIQSGIFNVLLGNVTSFPSDLFNGDARWLGVKVGADPEMSPRQQIVSVGYALRSNESNDADYSDDSDKLDGQHASAFLGSTEKAADADKLDGKDASEFLNTSTDYGRSGVSSTLYEDTTPLSDKYLGISAKAADADELDNLDSSVMVQTSGDQTVNGVKAFGSIPVLPASDPTQDNQAGRKAYIDSQDAARISIPASSAQGDVLYYNGSVWTRLPAGTSGKYLKTQGMGSNPIWETPPEGGSFGSWQTRSVNTVYYAETDGVVVGSVVEALTSTQMSVYTDSNNPPTTKRLRASGNDSIACPVRKGDYYKFEASGGPNFTVYWLPSGN